MTPHWHDATARATLRAIFDAAVTRAAPQPAVLANLPDKPSSGRCIVVGAGKASAAMAAAVEAAWPDVDVSGVVVTRYGHAVPAGRIRIVEASHPVPDANSELGARAVLDAARSARAGDLVLVLMSGGGSALMALPGGAMTLADKQAINRALLASGATISEMNAVRKHLSGIKGGRLAAAAGAADVVTLVISDVPGDDPATVGSGPSLPDPSSIEDVRGILARYELELPPAAAEFLAKSEETPKPGAAAARARLIATPRLALEAAADAARVAGLTPLILGDAIEGEAREVGIVLAGMARSVLGHGDPARAPAVLLSGGETTVSIGKGGAGRGGRNTELMLSFAVAMAGEARVWGIAGDSDGIDGTEDAAGAVVTPDTLARARRVGLDARDFLSRHDSYSFFAGIGDLVVCGPTLTNVNDIRAILVA